jgi:phage terminase large subunit-like protein
MSGEIPAGKYVRLAVERHLRDLERQETDEFPYRYDEEEAEDACLFFPVAFRHAKSKWAGQPFELSPWQMFCNSVLLGWKRLDGTRRFRRAHVSVARKNGKTTWCGGLAIYLGFADGEAAAEVYIGATKIDQARLLFRDSESMVRQSPALMKHAKLLKDNISFPGISSFIRPLGSDKPFDGLNPHAVFFDELHAWKELHRPFYDTMRTGSGARPQPLISTITTAGDDRSQLWKEETTYVKNVLEGIFVDDSIFGYIASIDDDDDPLNPRCWIKANPNLGVSVGMEYLEEMAQEARSDLVALNRFKRYHCNVMVSSTERAIDPVLWSNACEDLSDWRDADAVAAGFDLGGRDDLAAYALCARFLDGETEEGQPIYRFEVKQRSYMSKDTKRNLSEEPFASFVGQGILAVHNHAIQQLRDDLIAECDRYGVEYVAHDPYQAMQLAADLEENGLKPIKMPQNYAQFNEPIRTFLSDLNEKRISHDGDSILTWCCGNAVVVQDRTERWMFDKANSKSKIDPVVAMIMAYRACKAAPAAFRGPAFFV